MKKITALISVMIISISSIFCMTVMAADQAVPFQAEVYATEGEGLSLKAQPDINSDRYMLIPEGGLLYIDQVSDGWGHTSYSGYTGWVSLRYTRIRSEGYLAEAPVNGYNMTASYYVVHDTEGEGLEIRCRPSIESSTFGPLFDGTVVLVRAIQNDWAYICFNGHCGWMNLTYMSPWNVSASAYQVMVYGTGYEGLALKKNADLNSERYFMIPENTVLNISNTVSGWGYTSYNGYNGWVYLKYTRTNGKYPSVVPTYGYITPNNYMVYNTFSEGLELRTGPGTQYSTFGPMFDGSVLQVQAIQDGWAYGYYNGNYGWAHTTYLMPKS